MMVYISGPMTGVPEHNYPLFAAEAARLRRLGRVVVSPHELNPDGRNWYLCMAVDLWHLWRCDTIYLLPGWERSRGARIELAVAILLRLAII